MTRNSNKSKEYGQVARGLLLRAKNEGEADLLRGVVNGELIVMPKSEILEIIGQLVNQVDCSYLHIMAQDPDWLRNRAREQAYEADNYYWHGFYNTLVEAGISERMVLELRLSPEQLPPVGSRQEDKEIDIHWSYQQRNGVSIVILSFESDNIEIQGTRADGRSFDNPLIPFQLAMTIPSARALFQRLANLRQKPVFVAFRPKDTVICLEPRSL